VIRPTCSYSAADPGKPLLLLISLCVWKVINGYFAAATTATLQQRLAKSTATLQHKPIYTYIFTASCPPQTVDNYRKPGLPNPLRSQLRTAPKLPASYSIFENIKGLMVRKHHEFLDKLIEAFRLIGHRMQSPWTMLDASPFSVPQNHQRPILIGAKKGFKLPNYPTPTTCAAKTTNSRLPSRPSHFDALGGEIYPKQSARFPRLVSLPQNQMARSTANQERRPTSLRSHCYRKHYSGSRH